MGASQRDMRVTSADELCRAAYAASAGPAVGVALVAVGGYGRQELAPHSDLDVVLVHAEDVAPGRLAEELWYPLWDSGRRLDHSVRSLPEVVDAAADLKVALGLLDLRHLAGDPALTVQLRTTMLADWRRQARTRLPELKELVRRRHELLGELAHAAIPDLKDSAGGLRDVCVLRALQASWLVDASPSALAPAHTALLDVRDALHDVAGRATDRVAPEHWEGLADRLDLEDEAAAQRHVRALGRRVAHLSRLTWRRADAVTPTRSSGRGRRTPALEPVAPHLAISRGELVLDPSARPDRDPTLLLRAAAEAASRGIDLSPATAARLVRECPDLPDPWPPAARDAMVRMLAAGRSLLPVWETLEETGAVERFLPEWERIRLLPHASAIHRFTVDRHVIESVAEAGTLIRTVTRPDLLLVAALLHDIGKGGPYDHSAAGEPIARKVASRMGFAAVDVDRIALLVRSHLVLADLATTRDPEDPATATELTTRVVDAVSLQLLRALTEADARATAPAAWTDWRAGLIDRLTQHTLAALGATEAVEETGGDRAIPDGLTDGARDVVVEVEPHECGATVTVVAEERVGLLASVASALCTLRAPVRQARAWVQERDDTEWGWSTWEVADRYIDPLRLRELLRPEVGAAQRCACRGAGAGPDGLPAVVEAWSGLAQQAAVLEVRADDSPGLVHRVFAALAGLDLTVASAHVDTLGPQAVDVFYVQELGGVRPAEERAAAAAHAVRRAVGG